MIKCNKCNSTNILIIQDNVEFYVNAEPGEMKMDYCVCSDCDHEFLNDEQLMNNLLRVFMQDEDEDDNQAS